MGDKFTTIDGFMIKNEFAAIELELFEHEYFTVQAETLLKKFEGELTLQDLVALKITEKRLGSQDDQLDLLFKLQSDPELTKRKEIILNANPYLRDLKISTVTNVERQILLMPRQKVLDQKETLLVEFPWL